MIEIVNEVLHNDLGGAESYSANVNFDGITLGEVLEEIRQFTIDNNYSYFIDRNTHKTWGKYPNPYFAEHRFPWTLYIRTFPYVTEEYGYHNNKSVDPSLYSRKVKNIRADGNTYGMGYDFTINLEPIEADMEYRILKQHIKQFKGKINKVFYNNKLIWDSENKNYIKPFPDMCIDIPDNADISSIEYIFTDPNEAILLIRSKDLG